MNDPGVQRISDERLGEIGIATNCASDTEIRRMAEELRLWRKSYRGRGIPTQIEHDVALYGIGFGAFTEREITRLNPAALSLKTIKDMTEGQ
jgi:hypothetical protein